MITLGRIHNAIVALNNPKMSCPAALDQLVGSLQIYKERGEFDGSLASAIECLSLACYEIDETGV